MTVKPEKILYTAHATSTAGREGTSKSDDGVLDLKLTTPKGLGGNMLDDLIGRIGAGG